MGWFIQKSDNSFEVGPNLMMIFPNGKVPAKNDTDFVSDSFDPLYYTSSPDNNNVTWIFLSMHVSWKFVNLNHAFRSVIKDPTRTLHVYSDVGSSSMVGNRIVDLLREIKYDRTTKGQVYFEPQHIQYLPVRNQVTEIIEVEIAETIGAGEDLVKFGPGHTLVTLHFKKEDTE